MKKTLQDQYLLIKEGKGHKDVFIKEAKRQFPGLIRNSATYTEVANVLKSKNLINENVIGLEPINQLEPSKKESYEVAFENFLAEAKKEHFDDEKAEVKKPSKQVEEDAEKNFDYEDKKNPDNLIFDQIMKGYYTEMKDPKNESKTMEQLKAIVIKNLEKNPIYYTEKGQFGVKDLGYTMDAPGLGEPKEPKGKYKSSGYGNLNENKLLKEALNKDLKDFGSDVKKFLESKGLKVKLGQGDTRSLYDPIGKNDNLSAIQLQNPDLHIIVNDSKIDVLEDIIKRYNLKTLQSLRQTGGWDDDPKKKAQAKGEIYLTKELKRSRKGKTFELVVSRFDPSSVFVPSNNKESINEGIKETIKRLFKAAKKKLGMSDIVQATDEEFEYARDYGLKKYPGYSMSGIGVDQIQDIIHVAYMDVDSEDGDEVEIELPIPKNLNEETQIRKVVRSIINEELEEGYDDVFEDKKDDGFDEVWEKFKKDLRKRMGQPESPKNESLKESDDFNSRLDDIINNQYGGDPKVKEAAIDWNALQNVKMGSGREAYAPMLNQYWQDYGRETGNTGVMAAEEAGGFGFTTMYESKIRKVIRESVEKELQEINKLAEYEVFESKLEKIAELIEKKSARLNRLDEDEDLKALTDKKKVKELQKDIKKLEKAKAKIEKALAKKAKSTPKKKEVIDEDEPLKEFEKSAEQAKELETTVKSLEPSIEKLKTDIGSLEEGEEDEDANTDNENKAIDMAEKSLTTYPGLDMTTLAQKIAQKFPGEEERIEDTLMNYDFHSNI